MRVRIVVIYGAKIMNDSFKSNQNALTQAELASQLKLINIAEIEILQAVLLVINTQYFKERTDSWREIKHGQQTKVGTSDIFDLLANLSLTNLIEGEVIADAYSHIQTDYSTKSDRIDLSDVCALVLNHENVPALYATNAKEYNQQKQSYLSTYQVKVRKVIRQVVSQVNLEGSEHSFSANATAAKNQANARNVKSWDNANHSTLDE